MAGVFGALLDFVVGNFDDDFGENYNTMPFVVDGDSFSRAVKSMISASVKPLKVLPNRKTRPLRIPAPKIVIREPTFAPAITILGGGND